MIQPILFADDDSLSRAALSWLVERLRQRPSSLVCLAAGGTPTATYRLLAQCGRSDPALVAQLRLVQLDEWGGLAGDDPASCQRQLREQLIEPLGLVDRFVTFDGQAEDPPAECSRVAAWLAKHGPIDLCVLGLGLNGHLGFNEPADGLSSHAHVASLSATSLQHAMIGGSSHKPTYGLTLGMADILQGREVLLLVSGARKAGPLQRLLSGPISTDFPASLLHGHPSVALYCDASAAGEPIDRK